MEVVPRHVDAGLQGAVAKIRHHEAPLSALRPAPSHHIPKAGIVRTACSLTQAPPAVVKERIIESLQKPLVESTQLRVGELSGASAQKDGHPALASFELAFV